jgi:NADH dehydrogenase FAD-containing subunit
MHNITILGGNISGVSTAHYLLRHIIPSLNSTAGGSPGFKVTLISPSDRTYYKICAPRVLASVEISVETPFASIPDAFSHYKASEFRFYQGEAVAVDEAAKTVSVKITGTSQIDKLQYDSLVVATGMTSPSPLWTLHGDYKPTIEALENMHKRLPKAETILIAGGGPTGVETAGEIAYFFRPKDITLASGSSRLLPRLKNTGVSKAAEERLASLKVKTVHNVKVTSSVEVQDGRVLVTLSDGSTKTVDIYLDATSGKPNTGFLPASWLDDSKRLVTDTKTLRATKAPAGIYGIGDAASYSNRGLMDATFPVPALCYSIWSDLHATGSAALKEKRYKQIESDMQLVPIGPKGGAGVLFGVKLASFVVWMLKSRTFFLEKAPGLATGADFMKP